MAKQGTKTATPAPTGSDAPATKVGPPLLILALGFASLVASVPLASGDGVAIHALGYLAGCLIPIMAVGVVRRVDLDRRRSPHYVGRSFLRPALLVLAVGALAAAALHVWPIATELAS